VIYFVLTIVGVIFAAVIALLPLLIVLYVGEHLLSIVQFGKASRFFLVALKNLRRNLLRTSLTYLATFVLVLVVVMVWSVLYFLDILTQEKSKDLKVIISEKYQAMSQMPFAYAGPLSEGAADARRSTDVRPQDSMTWQPYVGTLDGTRMTRENMLFFIGMEPRKMLTILDRVMDDFTPGEVEHQAEARRQQLAKLTEVVKEMERNKKAVVVGNLRLAAINKKVGERIRVTGTNFTGIDLEFDIVGEIAGALYSQIAVMNRDYLNDAIDAYPRSHGGQKHPLADKSLSSVWLQVSDLQAFGRVAQQIDESSLFVNPAVKCETLSSGMSTWIEGYKDMFWAMRWLLAPAIFATMILVIANAISIGVRERRTEMAVLKVLGYRPGQILALVLGEAVLIGAISGFLSSAITYLVIDHAVPHSQNFNIWVPESALWWGPFAAALAAFAGSIVPAWSACKVRVSEVFARTA
jgi:putative ABC transport system permease protein